MMSDLPMTQGQRLRQLRRQMHRTQDEVAAHLNTTKQAIYKYETDIVRNIPVEKLRKLAELYGCSPAYLQGLTDDPGLPPDEQTAPAQAAEAPAPDTADAQLTYYRDLMDVMLRLTPAQRTTVLRFAQFLASQPQE